jgi:hypothetical protein
MTRNSAERRVLDRRWIRAGGRRSTDRPPHPVDSPKCPACQRTRAALPAGEADGGWWFVCYVCDHMWDERARAAPQPMTAAGNAR